ncbi:uncharacterized protein LOC125704983 isoform X3 [Brienomyrus brachyistius]|uniref:uncharacterized protein LOC125704983 isoform X3 n=1 Tax=Brienomyrus brachyistius TaxID=42636 RepID=UPI0020B18F1C|nr:uncharacterized protein LOC125704983 isoform X3 [Brienomyrus brachyistius]
MVHIEMKTESFSDILILFMFVINSDGFLLHGSAGPLTARLGGAVLLPCFVDRPLPLEELEVDWRRTDSDTIVHLFQGGQSRPESQGDAYRGRAHFFSQEIPKGNFSLLLDGVRTADAGVYKCVVYTEQEQRETRVEIQEVERLVVTGADEPVYAHAGEDVTLSCSVDTHVNVTELHVEWRKTDDDGDILVLLYTDGGNRPESQDGRYSGRAEFFTEEIPKGNFSMKLRKVRMEDKGEFRCEVHSDTDSANTTARIAALGYSSLHWLILGLCIAVTPVVLLTGALSVRHLRREGESRQALLSHWSHVTVPPIMVSSAFILWGITEGSTEEAVTCAVISLLNILVLFKMDPDRLSPDISWRIKHLARTVGSNIMIIVLCIVPVIKFLAKYSASTAGKVTLGVFVGGFVLKMVFMASMQFFDFWFWFHLTLERLKKILWVASLFLIIMILVAIGLAVFLAISFSDREGIAEIGSFLTIFIVPTIVFLIPFVGFGILLIHYLRSAEAARMRQFFSFFHLFRSLNVMFNILILTLYVHIIASMQRTFLLGYFIPITVASLGMGACIFAKVFLHSFRHFYLAQKILLGILITVHLILSFLYLTVILENDKGRPEKMCEFVFIYILTVTNNDDWNRDEHRAKPHKYVYFSGAFALPLLNSVSLAVALKLKADTGKQPFDLRLIVLISGSVFIFGWFVAQMSAYYLSRKGIIKEAFTQINDPELDQKPELIQDRLWLLQHADECQQLKESYRESWSCSRPQCRTMRRVLKHMDSCQAGTSCQVKHCASSCQIISHWENCTQDDCPICLPLQNEGYLWRYNTVTLLLGSHGNQEKAEWSSVFESVPVELHFCRDHMTIRKWRHHHLLITMNQRLRRLQGKKR